MTGGGTSRTSVENAPIGEEERALIAKQGELLNTQIIAFQRENAALAKNFPAAQELLLKTTQIGVAQATNELTRLRTIAGPAMRQAAQMIGVLPGGEAAGGDGGPGEFTTQQGMTTGPQTPGRQPVNYHDPALRERYTAETGVGALASDRNKDAAAGGTPFTQQFLDYADADAAKRGGAGMPFGDDARVGPGVTVAEPTSELETLSEQLAMETLQGRSLRPVSPEAKALLDTVYRTAGDEGLRLITRAGSEAASRRGLRLSDTPAARPYMEEVGRFGQQLSGQRAGAELALSQSQQGFTEGVRQFGATMGEGRRQFDVTMAENLKRFQEGLKQQAILNRLALTGSSGGGGGGAIGQNPIFAGGAGNPSATINSGLDFLRGRTGGQTSTTNQSGSTAQTLATAGAVAGGTGALVSGIAALAPYLATLSTARLKKDIAPLTAADRDGNDLALDALRETPLFTWRYAWEDESRPPHTGIILEKAPRALRSDDGWRISPVDYFGHLHAGTKALDRRVKRLELALEAA